MEPNILLNMKNHKILYYLLFFIHLHQKIIIIIYIKLIQIYNENIIFNLTIMTIIHRKTLKPFFK